MDFDQDPAVDHGPDHGPEDGVEHDAAVRTGVARIDEVLEAVEALADRPLVEHIEVFDHAHEQLRRALEARPGPQRPDL